MFFQPPYSEGRSRHGAPVRNIQNTALMNVRLSFAMPPHVPSRPGRCGASNSHVRSVMSCLRNADVAIKLDCCYEAIIMTDFYHLVTTLSKMAWKKVDSHCYALSVLADPFHKVLALDAIAGYVRQPCALRQTHGRPKRGPAIVNDCRLAQGES